MEELFYLLIWCGHKPWAFFVHPLLIVCMHARNNFSYKTPLTFDQTLPELQHQKLENVTQLW
jgi:hypothetical protein